MHTPRSIQFHNEIAAILASDLPYPHTFANGQQRDLAAGADPALELRQSKAESTGSSC